MYNICLKGISKCCQGFLHVHWQLVVTDYCIDDLVFVCHSLGVHLCSESRQNKGVADRSNVLLDWLVAGDHRNFVVLRGNFVVFRRHSWHQCAGINCLLACYLSLQEPETKRSHHRHTENIHVLLNLYHMHFL